jgi:hypothetical protein
VTDDKEIGDIIRVALHGLTISGKTGQKTLQPMIAKAINNGGYCADMEDKGIFLPAQMPVWRSKDDGKIETTKARRKIDIVVRRDGNTVALVETESDLNDLKLNGITKRNGHYDVLSIARAANGKHFNSYKSLERMAAAAYYSYLNDISNGVSCLEATARIEAVQSDKSSDHNPMAISLFLVTGLSRRQDVEILTPRLLSLNAQLISAASR